MHDDMDVKTQLDLHGSVFDQGGGYWLKIEAWRVEPSAGIPHGIQYSLTLHEPYGTRILGFDNAHAIKPPAKFKYAAASWPTTTSTGTPATRACPTSTPAPINC